MPQWMVIVAQVLLVPMALYGVYLVFVVIRKQGFALMNAIFDCLLWLCPIGVVLKVSLIGPSALRWYVVDVGAAIVLGHVFWQAVRSRFSVDSTWPLSRQLQQGLRVLTAPSSKHLFPGRPEWFVAEQH